MYISGNIGVWMVYSVDTDSLPDTRVKFTRKRNSPGLVVNTARGRTVKVLEFDCRLRQDIYLFYRASI